MTRGVKNNGTYMRADIMTKRAKDWTVSEVTFVKRGSYLEPQTPVVGE
jgi:hypothetical protein